MGGLAKSGWAGLLIWGATAGRIGRACDGKTLSFASSISQGAVLGAGAGCRQTAFVGFERRAGPAYQLDRRLAQIARREAGLKDCSDRPR